MASIKTSLPTLTRVSNPRLLRSFRKSPWSLGSSRHNSQTSKDPNNHEGADVVDTKPPTSWTGQTVPIKVKYNAIHMMKGQHPANVNKPKIPIPNIWLRDNCTCSECVHPDTRQRLLDTFKIPKDIAIKSHELKEKSIAVEFTDGHRSEYTYDFLWLALAHKKKRSVVRHGFTPAKLWTSTIKDSPPTVNADDVLDETKDGLKDLLWHIQETGFAYVEIPEPSSKPASELLETTEKVLRRIAFIRETHYGGFYDFTADLASADTAYTNIALEAHTDNTYFTDPAGLQAFHLLSHTDGSGGASLLVDGFEAARQLRTQDPKAYDILSTIPVFSHASGNSGISIQPYRGFPVFEHLHRNDLIRVRWNSSDRAGIGLPTKDTEKWYDAARKFDAILKKKENEYWEQLTPGRILIFNNWRVLHGRSAFTGKRRICGAYINRDDWVSRMKMLVFGQEKVLNAPGGSWTWSVERERAGWKPQLHDTQHFCVNLSRAPFQPCHCQPPRHPPSILQSLP